MAMRTDLWSGRHVFITGCTGLLGSWLTKALVENRANVTGLVRDSVPRSNLNRLQLHKAINIVRGEIEDYSVLERAINEYEIDTVFHLAAQTIVCIANRNPISTFETNIRGTWNVLEACRENHTVKRIVSASSDKAYGAKDSLPYDENMPLEGAHPYDVSKSCADLIARAYHKTYKLPVCITRCGNFYGGGDLNFDRIVPGTIKAVLEDRPPIIRSDGTHIRDYIYIFDAVEAYLLLCEKMEEMDLYGEAFNFSNESQVTVLELVEIILKLMEREDLKPTILGEAAGEIKHQYVSTKKARDILGWKPRYDLEAGLVETITWYKEFFRDFPSSGQNPCEAEL